jgi:metal transporter CNNM
MPLLNALRSARTFPLDNDMNIATIGAGEELGSPEFWWGMIVSTFLVLLGGVLSGCVTFRRKNASLTLRHVRLTLGLMGLDELHLRVLATSSENEKERKDAARGE